MSALRFSRWPCDGMIQTCSASSAGPLDCVVPRACNQFHTDLGVVKGTIVVVMPGSLAPADARSWIRCDYVFAWFAEKQALFQGWLVVDVWLSTLTQPLDDVLRNGLCLTLGCACCGLRMAVGSLWPSETKGRECLTDVIKKTRWLSAVCLHVAVLKEVWDFLALQGAETHSPKNRSNLNTVISNGKQKQAEDLNVLPLHLC